MIEQLSSCRFEDREQAATALEAIGGPALADLEAACQDSDPERRARASRLHAVIRRRVESARVLLGTTVQLDLRQATIQEATAELGRQTGQAFQAVEARAHPERFSLRTDRISLWQAVDHLARLGWIEGSAQDAEGTAKDATAVPTLYLISGKAVPSPTWEGGALRVRAIDLRAPGWGQGPGARLARCRLEARLEPSMAWQGPVEVRVVKAIDEAGHCLEQVVPEAAEPMAAVARTEAIHGSPYGGAPPTASATETVDVTLRLNDSPSYQLKELGCTLLGQVQTAPEVLAEVPDVAGAAGKSYKGMDDVLVKVLKVEQAQARHLRLELEIEALPPPELPGPAMLPLNVRQQLLMRNRVIIRRLRAADGPLLNQEIELRDGRGTLVLPDESQLLPIVQSSDRGLMRQRRTLDFEFATADGGPYRLAVRGRRTVPIEVGFTLKDVPLP